MNCVSFPTQTCTRKCRVVKAYMRSYSKLNYEFRFCNLQCTQLFIALRLRNDIHYTDLNDLLQGIRLKMQLRTCKFFNALNLIFLYI